MFNIILKAYLLKIATTLVLSREKEIPLKELFKTADTLETWVKCKDRPGIDKWLYGSVDGTKE